MDKSVSFQSYDDTSDPATCGPRLAALRAELKRRGLDGFIVPHSDEHQSEYLPANAERLAWLTAFTGSAGAAVVLADRAAVFVDGRYTLQVRRQTDTRLFDPQELVPDGPAAWIAQHLSKGARLGYDPWLSTSNALAGLKSAAERAGGALVACPTNPLDTVWTDRPPPPAARAVPHPFNLAGETAASKRARIAEAVKQAGADASVLTSADSICWLLNIRGADVPHTPFVLGFAILRDDASVELFLDGSKTSPELAGHLDASVRLRGKGEFAAALDSLKGKRVLVDAGSAAAAVFDRLGLAGATVKTGPDPCQLPKACKNPVEIEGARKAHIRDGAALSRFLAWFEAEAAGGSLTEIQAARQLESFRRATGCLSDVSFDTIAGAGADAAVVHYRVTRSTDRRIGFDEIFLVDSGAQYPDGTTDVTRTIIVGTPSAEMRDRFTRVLKGHIALATAKFPEGTSGSQLDAFARRPLWEAGLDYDHGTGHGVGSYLSVHEGPQNISKRPLAQPLKPGMIVSNEPGYYKTGEYGIRIENLVVVREAEAVPGGERKLLEFETITLAPIDVNLVEPGLMTEGERAWLNEYHALVFDTISPLVDEETRTWLKRATRMV